MSKKRLEALIQEKNGYITTQDAESKGIHREYLSLFVEEERLVRTAPGVYQLPSAWDDAMFNLQQKRKSMIFSHETALFMHGLSDREPFIYSVTLPTGYNTTQLNHNNLKTFTIKRDLLELGITSAKTTYGNTIVVYDIERTICDMLRSRNRVDKQVLSEGLKRYINNPTKDLNKLVKYAQSLGMYSVLKRYLELIL
jgi:predicted transcriptional regulator of viral defense system